MTWNWQLPDWSKFRWDEKKLQAAEESFSENIGFVIGAARHLNVENKEAFLVEFMSAEALDTSEIEGEFLNRDSVQSSIRRALGLAVEHGKPAKPTEIGVAEMMVNLYRTWRAPLKEDVLFHWLSLLMQGRQGLIIGAYRDHTETMQIVSSPDYARKIHSKNSEAIEWLLITDLEVTTFEQACEKIDWHTCRWQIELYFKILKSGCTIERLQLQDRNFSTCLSFYMIIAWRILYVVFLSRCCPDISCEIIFSQEEWQTAYVVLYKKKLPKTAPTLNKMTRMIAMLGGYQNRKNDLSPGIKTIWIGMRNMQEHLKAREAFETVYGKTCR